MNYEHLRHCLRHVDDAVKREALVESTYDGGEPSAALLSQLGGKAKFDALREEWSLGSGRAVAIWDVPSLDSRPFEETEKMVRDRCLEIGSKLTSEWGSASKRPAQLSPRVARVRLTATSLHLMVFTLRKVSVREEEDQVAHETSVQVEVEVPRAKPGKVRVFATPQAARSALREVLKWLFDLKIEPGRGQSEHFRAVEFEEKHVHRVAKALGMELSGFVTQDTVTNNGEITVKGRSVGSQLAPVDSSNKVVAQLVKAPGDERAFNYVFPHPDGFAEQGRVNFRIKYRPAHLQFPLKTSRSAMLWVEETLLTELGRK